MNSSDKTAPGQDKPVEIELDGKAVTAPERRLNGLQIRQLGDPNRVDGFETQKLLANGKKERTIPDTEVIELHPNEKFRTVPNQGGPGGRS
jgi:hypothetical protein